MKENFNKKVVLLLRILMFLLGVLLGYFIMRQLLPHYEEELKPILKLLFYSISALFLGGVLALSAKPIMYLSIKIGHFFKKIFANVQPSAIAGGIIGLMIGIMMGYLMEIFLALVLPIIALRIVIDIFIAAIFTFLGALGVVRWLRESEETEVSVFDAGYILTASALSSDKIVELVREWLAGDKVILESASEEILKGDNLLAKENYAILTEEKLLKTVKSESSLEEYAFNKSLKIVALKAEEINDAQTLKILSLEFFSAESLI